MHYFLRNYGMNVKMHHFSISDPDGRKGANIENGIFEVLMV